MLGRQGVVTMELGGVGNGGNLKLLSVCYYFSTVMCRYGKTEVALTRI